MSEGESKAAPAPALAHFKAVTSSHFFQTLKLTPVELPELETDDGSVAVVYVKPMSGKHGLKMGHSQLKAGKDATEEEKEEATDRTLASVVGRSVFREDGERIFTDEEADRIDELLSASVFMKLATAIGAVNTVKDGGKDSSGADGAPEETPEKKD